MKNIGNFFWEERQVRSFYGDDAYGQLLNWLMEYKTNLGSQVYQGTPWIIRGISGKRLVATCPSYPEVNFFNLNVDYVLRMLHLNQSWDKITPPATNHPVFRLLANYLTTPDDWSANYSVHRYRIVQWKSPPSTRLSQFGGNLRTLTSVQDNLHMILASYILEGHLIHDTGGGFVALVDMKAKTVLSFLKRVEPGDSRDFVW